MDERTRTTDDKLAPTFAGRCRDPTSTNRTGREGVYAVGLISGMRSPLPAATRSAAGLVPPIRRAPRRTVRKAAPQPVGAATIAPGDIRVILNALGTVTPLATVTVQTADQRPADEVGFQEGQMVKKGDFLAQIDPRPYQVLQRSTKASSRTTRACSARRRSI